MSIDKIIEIEDTAIEILGSLGRMLSASKSFYLEQFPENKVVFNANVYTKNGKIWYGDIDVTKDSEKVDALATELGERVYVLREMDGRFDNEGSPKLEKAVYITG